MLLCELQHPSEYKYGGVLTGEERARCVRETELPGEWDPYPRRPVEIENICGRFEQFQVDGGWRGVDERLRSVTFKSPTPFGAQTELFHLRGQVLSLATLLWYLLLKHANIALTHTQMTARCAPGLEKTIGFKGVRGYDGLREMIGDAFLPETTVAKVHMAVLGSCIGRRVQTSPGCYIENRVGVPGGALHWLRVGGRSIDQFNVVRLYVWRWDAVGLDPALRPVANDIVLTCRGSILHRLTWNGAGCGLEWTQESQAAVAAACQRVADALGGVC